MEFLTKFFLTKFHIQIRECFLLFTARSTTYWEIKQHFNTTLITVSQRNLLQILWYHLLLHHKSFSSKSKCKFYSRWFPAMNSLAVTVFFTGRPYDRSSNETTKFMKHVSKYKNKRKWMVEFLRKSDSRRFKIDRVNLLRITKPINFLWFCAVLVLRSVVMLKFLN